MMNQYFFKCHMIKMITFMLCNIFEQIWYSEFILLHLVRFLMNQSLQAFLDLHGFDFAIFQFFRGL